jgi:hypothetical protein
MSARSCRVGLPLTLKASRKTATRHSTPVCFLHNAPCKYMRANICRARTCTHTLRLALRVGHHWRWRQVLHLGKFRASGSFAQGQAVNLAIDPDVRRPIPSTLRQYAEFHAVRAWSLQGARCYQPVGSPQDHKSSYVLRAARPEYFGSQTALPLHTSTPLPCRRGGCMRGCTLRAMRSTWRWRASRFARFGS